MCDIGVANLPLSPADNEVPNRSCRIRARECRLLRPLGYQLLKLDQAPILGTTPARAEIASMKLATYGDLHRWLPLHLNVEWTIEE